MTFSIGFTGERTDYDPEAVIGELQLGQAIEIFHADLGVWGTEDYERSWMSALQRVVDGAAISDLITSMPDMQKAAWVDTWALYRVGDEVYVQNIGIIRGHPDINFNPETPWESIHPRITVDEDGLENDEWCVGVDDIREFLESKDTTRS